MVNMPDDTRQTPAGPVPMAMQIEASLLGLPDELLVQIISYLPPPSVIPLHSTCRRLRNLTRTDRTLWRSLCAYQEAHDVAASEPVHPAFALAPLPTPPETAENGTPARVPAAWPLVGEREGIDWYNEYRYRHAPLKMRWFSPPPSDSPGSEDDVKGVSVFSSRCGEKNMVLCPLADGSVCVWSLQDSLTGRSGRGMGEVVARSKPGLVFPEGDKWKGRRKAREAEIVDGVSVDEVGGKLWVAGEEGLVEIDLNTLQKISTHRFPFSITTLSQTSNPHPLTIGTTLTLHLHDPRLPALAFTSSPSSSVPSTPDELCDPPPAIQKHYARHAPLFQPGPLSILHSSGGGGGPQGEIYVAGRFPSILVYERRMWPKLRGTIHSGGRLCGLATFPSASAFPCDSDIEQSTLVACGEYNGRGTLELYRLPSSTPFPAPAPAAEYPFPISPSPSLPISSPLPIPDPSSKNRQTASRSKILTVATHGTRIVTGDADGCIKWCERDGRTLVRRYLIDPQSSGTPEGGGLWACSNGGGEVVRKICTTTSANSVFGPSRGLEYEEDGLVVWTGDRVGYLGFTAAASEGGSEQESENDDRREVSREREYCERMKSALQRQAAEVRIVEGLGMP